jgi:hypothetical protein
LFRRPKLTLSCSAEGKEGRKFNNSGKLICPVQKQRCPFPREPNILRVLSAPHWELIDQLINCPISKADYGISSMDLAAPPLDARNDIREGLPNGNL